MRNKFKKLLKKFIVYIPGLNTLYKQRAWLRSSVYKLSQRNREFINKINSLNNEILRISSISEQKSQELGKLQSNIKELEDILAQTYYDLHFLPKLDIQTNSKSKGKKKKSLENILTVNQGDKGGAAKVALRLSDNLVKLKYNVDVLLGSYEFDLKKNMHALERNESIIQQHLHNYQKESSWDDLLNLSSQKIKDLSIFKGADIVHFHNLQGAGGYFSLFDLVELSKLKPSVWTLHDMLSVVGDWKYYLEANDWDAQGKEFPYTNPNYEGMSEHARFNLKAKELIYKNIDTTIVCPAQWLVDKVKNSVLKDKDIRLVHNGIDETIFKPYDKNVVRKELGLPGDKKILLFQANSGKYNVWKGPEYLEKALQHFQSSEDVVFLNIGGDDNNEPGWINIKYIEDENKMAKYFSAADIFIYPSLADICPLTVLEAQSCGLPVVAFRTGGVPEIIKHMETGYISGYKNMDDFIKGIELFLTDSDLQKKASMNARKSIEEEFTLDIMTQKYIKVYEDTLWKK